MQIEHIGPNQTQIFTNEGSVFFSYSTPVCAKIKGKLYRTATRHSVTTSKHINKFLGGRNAEEMPQEFFDNLS